MGKIKHGARLKGSELSRTYNIWRKMRQRCEKTRTREYYLYGGRGIKVCKRWNDFKNFLEDMGKAPDDKNLERINNEGNYCPKNCKWASWIEQANNRRGNVKITHNGETLTLAQWSRKLNINYNTLRTRLKRQGLSFEKAIKTATI